MPSSKPPSEWLKLVLPTAIALFLAYMGKVIVLVSGLNDITVWRFLFAVSIVWLLYELGRRLKRWVERLFQGVEEQMATDRKYHLTSDRELRAAMNNLSDHIVQVMKHLEGR